MKVIFLVLLFTFSLFGAELNWPNDYQKALKDAKAQKKLVYVFITSDSCRWCRKFEDTTLECNQIKKRLAKKYITVHLSRDRHTISKQFETAPVPRHYFIDSNGEILYSSLGYRDIEIFNAFMDNAEEKYQMNKKENKIKGE